MNSADMASLVPNPDELLAFPIEKQGKWLLELLAPQHYSRETAVAHSNFFNRANDSLNPPKYGNNQRDVDAALMSAWSWVESRGFFTRSPSSAGNWVYVDNAGKEFIKRNALYEQLERLGVDRVKSELNKEKPRIGTVGGPPNEKDWAWEWLRTKEAHAAAAPDSSEIASALLDEINKLLSEVPKTIHDSNVAAWWGKAKNVIEGWNPSKSADGKSAAELFFSNLESIGKGASERRRGQHEMIALLNQAKHDLELRTTVVKMINSEPAKVSRKVFIVHGHDEGAREAVARFLERVGLEPIILHEQPSRGRTVIEKFEAHCDVGFAVVLLTADDEGCEKGGTPRPRARQNVVLELGYFIGRLGRNRVCALKRGDLEIPSDFTGVVYVPFDDSDGWKQALGRELQEAGFQIDWSKAMGTP